MFLRAFVFAFCLVVLPPAFLLAQSAADLVVFNAKVYTMNERFDVAQALAVKNGRILEVGTSSALLKKFPNAPNFDAQGRAVYPGFIDAHAHFVEYAALLATVNLTGAKSWRNVFIAFNNTSPKNHRRRDNGLRGMGGTRTTGR